MKPTSGTPTIAAQKPARVSDNFSKKRRRLISSGVSTDRKAWLAMFSLIANFCNPSSERRGEQGEANKESDQRGDQSPKEERNSHRQTSGEIGRVRQMFRGQHFPIRMRMS